MRRARQSLLCLTVAFCYSALLLSLAACHVPTSVVTPQGKAAYSADQVVIRVGELQSAAIQAQASGALPITTTRLIVQWCVNANTTLKQVPNGWQQTLTTAWTQTKSQIPATDLSNSAIAAAVSGVDVVLAALGGN
jgi:hypothetical protein